MPFPTQDLETLKGQVLARVKRGLNLRASPPVDGNTAGISYAVAGQRFLLDEHLVWNSKQLFATLAEAESLSELASELGIAGRRAAAAALGGLIFRVTQISGEGISIPQGTLVRRADGEVFRTTEVGISTLLGNVVIAAAAVEAGKVGNTLAGVQMRLVTPIVGVDQTVTVADGGLTGGAEQETTESLRARVLRRRRSPPMGGTTTDYVAWAETIPGVTRAWCVPNWNLPNGVLVMFVCDDNVDTILPSGQKIQEVRDYISDRSRQPVGSVLYVQGPQLIPVNYVIRLKPNDAQVQSAVIESLRELHLTRAEPRVRFELSWIEEAISYAAGEISHTLVFPINPVNVAADQLPVYGETLFVE